MPLVFLLSVSTKYRKLFKLLLIAFVTLVPISSTSLVLSALQSHYEVGSNVTLTCFVTNSNPHHVDIDTTVNIQWSSQNNSLKQSHIHSYNKGFNHTLTQLKLSDAGEYKCSYYLTSTNDNPYIKQSEFNTGVTTVMIKSEFITDNLSHLLLHSS